MLNWVCQIYRSLSLSQAAKISINQLSPLPSGASHPGFSATSIQKSNNGSMARILSGFYSCMRLQFAHWRSGYSGIRTEAKQKHNYIPALAKALLILPQSGGGLEANCRKSSPKQPQLTPEPLAVRMCVLQVILCISAGSSVYDANIDT
jgi:hypothetical protein